MTDYDEVRNCHMAPISVIDAGPHGSEMVDVALREVLFQAHFVDYSGRRGIHCWVNDDKARKLSNEVRTVVNYLFGSGGKEKRLEDELKNSKITRELEDRHHPHLKRSFDILKLFADYITDNDGRDVRHVEELDSVLNSIPDCQTGHAIHEELANEFKSDRNLTGKQRWELVKGRSS